MTVNVSGIGDVPYYQDTKEYTSDLVQNTYDTNMQAIQDLFSKPAGYQYTAADYQKLQGAMDALQNMAKNGDTTTAGGPFSFTQLMLTKMGSVFPLLENAGLTPGSPNPDVNAAIQNMQMLQQWNTKNPNDGSTITFSSIVTQATLGVSGSNLSLQSQVGTDFVVKGNQYYQDQLAQLQQAMQTGVTVQTLLSQLQEYRNNNISVPPSNLPPKPSDPSGGVFRTDKDKADAITQYQKDLAAYNTALTNVNKPVPPTINHSAAIGQQIIDAKTSLEAQIAYLTGDPKGNPPGAGQSLSDPASLASQLKAVVNGINQAFGTTTPSGQLSPGQLDQGSNVWLLDGKNDTVGAGTFTGQIAQAMAGSGSFNSTQRDNFNQAQKAADQIYTISASILQTLSDSIKKMADNAAR